MANRNQVGVALVAGVASLLAVLVVASLGQADQFAEPRVPRPPDPVSASVALDRQVLQGVVGPPLFSTPRSLGTAPSQNGVGFTLVAANDSMVRLFRPPVPGQLSGAAYDYPENGLVYVGDSQGSCYTGSMVQTGRAIAETVRTGWTPLELAWDQGSGSILVGTGGGLPSCQLYRKRHCSCRHARQHWPGGSGLDGPCV